MALSEEFSSQEIQGLLKCLTEQRSDQECRRDANPRLGWSDGRQKFGSVIGAVKEVMAEADGEMAVREVHAAVEKRLGESISFPTVADCLIRYSKGKRVLFERTRYGHYRPRY
jgi:hypothetical protein